MNFHTSYCLENPRTHQVLVIRGCCFALAALLGSFVVLVKAGPRAFVKAVPVNILFVVGIGLSIFASAWLGGLPRIFLLFAMPLVLMVLQGRAMVQIMRNHFAARGWYVHEL